MKKLISATFIAVVIISFAMGEAMATAQTATIQTVAIDNTTGRVQVLLNGPARSKSGCVTSDTWVFDGTTATGKNMLSAALTAYVSGKTVLIAGSSTCVVAPGTGQEDILFIQLQ